MANKDGSYPSDVSDEEWEFCVGYLTLMKEDAPQREYSLRAVFNALRYLVRSGCEWRMLPHNFPPWHAVWQQTQRWVEAEVFEEMAHDLRALIRFQTHEQRRHTLTLDKLHLDRVVMKR
jgi:transposase